VGRLLARFLVLAGIRPFLATARRTVPAAAA